MEKTSKYIAKTLLLLLVVSVLLIPLFGGVGITYASTADNNSFVLYDLQNDANFNESDYVENADDYSLQVISIAESADDELFVYVYQPSGETADLRATSINISKGYKTLKFYKYKLSFCNSYKTLYKYKVDNFQIDDTRQRYYDITSIYRAWNKDYGDEETGNDNTIDEVYFNVSTIYKIGVENGEFVVETRATDTIEIVNKYVGFVRYYDGFKLYKSACDSHFVAFSTDIPIDELYEADIYYVSQSFSSIDAAFVGHRETFGEKIDKYSYVTSEDDVKYETDGWFNVGTINRDRIVKVADFIANENISQVYPCGRFNVAIGSSISESAIKNLKQCEWVVRFAETSYSYSPSANNYCTYTIVGSVSILRLEGMSNGEPFNLGVIDNKQSGSGDPINDWDVTVYGSGKDILRILKIVFAVLGAVLFVALVCWVRRLIVVPAKTVNKVTKSIKKRKR